MLVPYSLISNHKYAQKKKEFPAQFDKETPKTESYLTGTEDQKAGIGI